MSRSGALTSLVRTVAGFGIWFVLLAFVGRAVLRSRAVEQLDFAVYPFSTEFYPMGLAWSELIRIGFFTVIIFFVLTLGARLREDLPLAFPQLYRLGNIAYLTAILASVILGFLSYDYLIVPPLEYQGIAWVFNLIFWLSVSGILVGVAFESVQMVLARRKAGVSAVHATERPAETAPSSIQCEQCGASIDLDDNYCRRCGAKLKEDKE